MAQLKKTLLKLLFFVIPISINGAAAAQDWKSETKVNLLFGLTQPLLASGFNIEGNYIHNRLIFDYSHGVSLDFEADLLTKELKRQKIVIHQPWTTGLGIGYRLKEWINLRFEPKWHRFEFYYDGEPQNKITEITSYNTFSIGIGIYGAYLPFKNKENFLKGLLIAPSVRFWPTISSNLKDDKFSYHNKKTNAIEQIKTLDPGIGFTPLIVNLSIGYSFQLDKKK